ncbi:MAG: IS3 family transposase [Acidobacteriota bacterium]|nr:IS3 family transposase [Acidobacteriota bacterium]
MCSGANGAPGAPSGADRHPRYGYRRIWALLRQEGFEVNHKRIRRLWVAEGLKVPPAKRATGKKAAGSKLGAAWNVPAAAPNDVRSYDFVAAKAASGGQIRVLNVVDEHTRRALGARVARSIGSRDVIEELQTLFAHHGKPRRLRSEHGREFVSGMLVRWLAD